MMMTMMMTMMITTMGAASKMKKVQAEKRKDVKIDPISDSSRRTRHAKGNGE